MVVGIDSYSRDLPEDESIRQLRPVVDPQGHQQLSVVAELRDLVVHGIGDPHVVLGVNVQPMG